MSIKQWKLNHISAEKSRILSSEYDLPPLVSDVLVGRGLDTPQAVEDFFSADSDFFDPFSILDMDRAAERILQALERDEKIAGIAGDYDCDGVTATAILYQIFCFNRRKRGILYTGAGRRRIRSECRCSTESVRTRRRFDCNGR